MYMSAITLTNTLEILKKYSSVDEKKKFLLIKLFNMTFDK